MTKEEILAKAKYILVESYNDVDETIHKEIEENKIPNLEYLKDKPYLKIGNPDSSTRYNESENYHHYTTKFLYSNLQSIMDFIGVKEFNFNDFVLRENKKLSRDNNGVLLDFSYLFYIKPVKYKIICHHYELQDNGIINYIQSGDIIECNYNFLTNVKLNHLLGIFYNKIPFTNFHRLNYLAHDCGIIENLSTTSDKTLLISSDSHAIPLIPILSCYYKKVICLDSRFNGNDTSSYWINEDIDDVIIMPSFNANIEKYIDKNFIS